MKVLLDVCTPVQVRYALPGHDVHTAAMNGRGEEQDASSYQLTDEQLAEVKRRFADPGPTFLTLEEVRERFARRRA